MDSDSEDEIRESAWRSGVADAWIRFIQVEAGEPEFPLPKNPFLIKGWLEGLSKGGFSDVRWLRSGALLVECVSRVASKKLLDCTEVLGVRVRVSGHPFLNTSKGVIRCSDLYGLSEVEIRDGLKDQGVVEVHRVLIKREGESIPTNTCFLTFASPSLPSHILVGYVRVKVSLFVPSPLRCFKCQKFGHTSRACKGAAVCRDCAKSSHDGECSSVLKCVNCGGNHASSSKDCPSYKTEYMIQKVKAEKRCSFREARAFVEANSPSHVKSYAAATGGRSQSNGPEMSSGSDKKLDLLLTRILDRLDTIEKFFSKSQSPSTPELLVGSVSSVVDQGKSSTSASSSPAKKSPDKSESQKGSSGRRSPSKKPSSGLQSSGQSSGRERSGSMDSGRSRSSKGVSFGADDFIRPKNWKKFSQKGLKSFSNQSSSGALSQNRFSDLNLDEG